MFADDADSARALHRFAPRKDRQETVVPDTPVVAPMPVTQVVTDAEVLAGASGPTKICSCSSLTCNCCRDFALPVVPVKGPGMLSGNEHFVSDLKGLTVCVLL